MPEVLEAVIDESGDAGTGGKGTRWLVIALVLDEGGPGELAALLQRIKAERNRPCTSPRCGTCAASWMPTGSLPKRR